MPTLDPTAIDRAAIDQLFRAARAHDRWTDEPVPDDTLRELFEILKYGPTSANCSPARFLFLRTPDSKDKLAPALSSANREKTITAPVVVIVAQDPNFHDHLPKLFPQNPSARSWFTSNPMLTETTMFRNATLQGAYLIMAARALGLDCGPMSGFNNSMVDDLFLSDRGWKSNFLMALGKGDPSVLKPRPPRFDFDDACVLL